MRARLLLVAALLATMLTAIPGPAATPAEAAACPANPTAEQLIAMGWELGPLTRRFPPAVGFINEPGRACYGDRLLRFRAFVDDPLGLGGASAYTLAPAWLFSPSMFIYTVDRSHRTAEASVPFTGLYVPPRLGNLRHRYFRTWVTIEAHFMDPAARTCRAKGAKGATPNHQQAIRICQAELVVVSIRRAGAMPDTATAPPNEEAAPDRWLVVLGVAAAIATSVALLMPGRRRRGP